jgi:hypothetical protein
MCLALMARLVTLGQEGHRLEARLADAEARAGAAGQTVTPASPPVTTPAHAADQPHANVPLVDLFPRDAARGGRPDVPTIEAGASPFVVLILNVRRPEAGATYVVEIAGADAQPIWTSERVAMGTEPLTLAVPRSLLSGDRYRVRLHRVRGERRTLIEEYDVRVTGRPASPRP